MCTWIKTLCTGRNGTCQSELGRERGDNCGTFCDDLHAMGWMVIRRGIYFACNIRQLVDEIEHPHSLLMVENMDDDVLNLLKGSNFPDLRLSMPPRRLFKRLLHYMNRTLRTQARPRHTMFAFQKLRVNTNTCFVDINQCTRRYSCQAQPYRGTVQARRFIR